MPLLDPNESPCPSPDTGDFTIKDHATERDEPEEEESYHPEYLEVRFFLACGTVKKIFLEERDQVIQILDRYEDAIVEGKDGVMNFPGKTTFTLQFEDGSQQLMSRDVTVVIPIMAITLIEADMGESPRPIELIQNEDGQTVARFKEITLEEKG